MPPLSGPKPPTDPKDAVARLPFGKGQLTESKRHGDLLQTHPVHSKEALPTSVVRARGTESRITRENTLQDRKTHRTGTHTHTHAAGTQRPSGVSPEQAHGPSLYQCTAHACRKAPRPGT